MSVSAPVYVTKVLQWIEEQINNNAVFPNGQDQAETLKTFQTPQFAALCGQIYRRICRVYGIFYSTFLDSLKPLDMEPHLKVCFKLFMFFCMEFRLLPERELDPLEEYVKPIRLQYHRKVIM